jgi:hypothetical protein
MTDRRSRRRFLLGLGTTSTTVLAGCNGSGRPDTPTEEPAGTGEPTETDTTTPAPAALSLAELTLSRDSTGQFQPVEVTVRLANAGGSAFEGDATVTVDGRGAGITSLSVPPGERTEWTVAISEGVVGDHEVRLVVDRARDDTEVLDATRPLEVTRYPEQFVGVDGTEFTCGGGSLYLNGSNDQQVVATQIPEARIEEVFALAADLGMNVMRVFGFGVPWSEQASQPAPGEYNEAFFERFDRIVATAKRHDIRLVVPLVNDNRSVDSIARYVEWVDGASEHNDFYEMDACRSLYKDYVEHVLTRENTLTGLEYREDPTIAMWELGNELNCQWPKKYPLDWITDVGGHVKTLDDNHLLSSGVVGLQWGPDPNDKQSWRDEITEETALIRSNEPDVVDAASVHFYPDPHMSDIEDPDGTIRDIVGATYDLLGKPVYFGEFNWGVRLDEGEELSSRVEHLTRWYDAFAELDVCGAIVHEISTPAIADLKSGSRGTHNIVPAKDERTSEILRSHSRWARQRSTSDCPGGTARGE